MPTTAAGILTLLLSAADAQTTGVLKIVIIAGEDAVNIIQQKTAVAPIVEVRDRNDQPVAGAVVNFAIRSGRASFGGARTLSVTTDAVGRAIASTLTPTGSGALQITASAAFQGQTAVVTIAQTNVMTAAQAAAISASTGSTGGAGPSAAGGAAGGGGMSGTTIGILGGVAAAGALAATQLAGEGENGSTSGSPPPSSAGPIRTTYSGPVNGQWTMTTTSTGGTTTGVCASTRAIVGTLTMTLEVNADGSVTGSANTAGTQTEVNLTVSPLCTPLGPAVPFARGGSVTGSTGSLGFRAETTSPGNPILIVTTTTFAGSLSGTTIAGTITHGEQSSGTSSSGTVINGSGSNTFPVTLTRQ